MKMSRQTGAYKNFFLADEKCKFDLESNWNFLNGKSRPESLISSQISPNEILFGIKLKSSYILANSPQRNSI